MSSLSLTSSEPQPRKRLIIKIKYPVRDDSMIDDDHSQKRIKTEHCGKPKPIVSCYWLDSTISLAQHKMNNNNTNVVAHTTTDQNTKKKEINTWVSPKDSKDYVGHKNMIKESTSNDIKPIFSSIKEDNSTKKCGVKNVNEEELKKKEKKKPMEHYKRMQCWVILKRMIEGKDGWALKEALDVKYLEKYKSNVKKTLGLKDIEAKLKSYSNPNEFAEDMRFMFSHGMLYPSRDGVYQAANRQSDIFEEKWKTLKMEWTFEDRRRLNKSMNNIHKRKRELLHAKIR